MRKTEKDVVTKTPRMALAAIREETLVDGISSSHSREGKSVKPGTANQRTGWMVKTYDRTRGSLDQ